MLKHYFKLTMKLLRRKRVFTFVTMAGIVSPVVLIVLTASFLTHINDYNPPRSQFKNVVYLDNVTLKEIYENGEVNMNMSNPPTYFFIQKYIKTMTTPVKIGVISVPSFEQDIIYLNSKPYEIDIRFTDHEFWQITDFEFINGRSFNKTEFDSGSKVAIIDKKTSLAYFGTVNPTGKNITIKNENYKVIGVVENVDIMYFRLFANIFIPLTCSEEFQSKSVFSAFSIALLQANSSKDYEKLNNEYQKRLEQFSFADAEPFNYIEGSLTKDDYLGRLKLTLQNLLNIYHFNPKVFYLVVGILIFLFIILPAINLVNININRVYERFSEIGIRRSFGSSRKKLVEQFLLENLIVTFLGGLISAILAFLIIACVNCYDLLGGIYLSLNSNAFIISILSIFLLGILSGLAPSIHMARKKIVLSLNSMS